MNPLDRLDPEELVALSDADFQESIKQRAKALAASAMDTIEDVMVSSDDDQARLIAANKTLDLAGARDDARALPFGISDEVFRIALAGFGQLAAIAGTSHSGMILRDVTPAKTDPRPLTRITDAQAIAAVRDDEGAIDNSELPEGLQLEDIDEE